MSEQRYEVVSVCTGQACVYDRLNDEGFAWFSDGCDDWREKAATCAAALNAAEQATKERELLEKMADWITEAIWEWGADRGEALLAEYAALTKEQP